MSNEISNTDIKKAESIASELQYLSKSELEKTYEVIERIKHIRNLKGKRGIEDNEKGALW